MIEYKFEDLINGPDIFADAKFGKHYEFDGNDAIFLEKLGEPSTGNPIDQQYKIVVNHCVHYKDGSYKEFTSERIVHANGFAFCWEDDEGNEHPLYVHRVD